MFRSADWPGVATHAPGSAGVRNGRDLARDNVATGVRSPSSPRSSVSASGLVWGKELARGNGVEVNAGGVDSKGKIAAGEDDRWPNLGGNGVAAQAPGGLGVLVDVKLALKAARWSLIGVFPSASSSDDDGGPGRSGRSSGGEGVRKSKIELPNDVRRGGVTRENEGDISEVGNRDPGLVEGGVPGGVALTDGSPGDGLRVWERGESLRIVAGAPN